MATLAELRKKVQVRLRDWNQNQWNPLEINALLNEAQDAFTRDSEYLTGVDVQSIVASTARYTLTPASGMRIGRVISVAYYDGSTDRVPLIVKTQHGMNDLDSDWRNRTGEPTHCILNFNDVTESSASNDSVRLYPNPTTSVTNGLRTTYVLLTDGAMTTDVSTMLLPERIAEEALINYATAEASVRRATEKPELASSLMSQASLYRSRYEKDLMKARMEALNGYATIRPFISRSSSF